MTKKAPLSGWEKKKNKNGKLDNEMDLLIRGRKEGGLLTSIRTVQAKSRGSEAHVSATQAPNPNEPTLFSLGSLALRLPQAGQTR